MGKYSSSGAHRLAILLLLNYAAVILLLSSAPLVNSDEEDNLLQGINSFRQSARAPPLSKHDKANCVADRIANQLEDQHCGSHSSSTTSSSSQLISNYPDVVRKCKVDINTTRDGMILPVCVPRRVPTLVLTNYTASDQNSRYLNDSRFTGAGIGTEDDWTVLVLTTSATGGSFAMSRACRHQLVDGHYKNNIPSLVFAAFLLLFVY